MPPIGFQIVREDEVPSRFPRPRRRQDVHTPRHHDPKRTPPCTSGRSAATSANAFHKTTLLPPDFPPDQRAAPGACLARNSTYINPKKSSRITPGPTTVPN